MKSLRLATDLVSILAVTGVASAHIPIFSNADTGTTPETAVFIDDASISHAVYHEVTNEAPLLWITFDLQEGQEIYVQLGAPVLDRLADFRPAVAVLGPGLPDIDLPFDIPEGLGGILFTTDDVDDPEYFYEKFTGTESWIFGELVDAAAEPGKHYAVAYVPSGEPGKLWVALGRRELFESQDIAALATLVPQVREFHEVANPNAIPCFLLPAAAISAFYLVASGYMRRTRLVRRKRE